MIALLALSAVVVLDCGQLPPSDQQRCGLGVQQFICWTTESDHISDHDPALLLFWNRDEGERLEDAKIGLAIERVNGCEKGRNDAKQ